MMSPSELDELLKAIVDEGSASARPAELAELRATFPSEQMGEELPRGTKVVYAEPEASAPESAAARMPIVPKVVDVPKFRPSDDGRAAALAADRDARRAMALERGGRELVAGLTRTQAQPVTQRPTNAFELWAQQQQRKQQDALRQKEAENNAARTQAYATQSAAQLERAEKKMAFDEQEAKARGERFAKQSEQDAAEFEERKRHNRAAEGIGWTTAKRAGDKAERDEERLRLKTDALKPRQGWEPIEQGAPTFRDAAQAKSFDDSVAAMGAIRNHRDHVLHEIEALKKAKTPTEVDTIVGRLNAQMGALASKLRDAEGLNNTDAANHAIETMLSLQNGSAVNWKNVVNQGRLPAILNAAINSGEANLDTVAESNNLRRAKAAPMKMRFPDGSVHEVPPEKLELAKRKGAVPNG